MLSTIGATNQRLCCILRLVVNNDVTVFGCSVAGYRDVDAPISEGALPQFQHLGAKVSRASSLHCTRDFLQQMQEHDLTHGNYPHSREVPGENALSEDLGRIRHHLQIACTSGNQCEEGSGCGANTTQHSHPADRAGADCQVSSQPRISPAVGWPDRNFTKRRPGWDRVWKSQTAAGIRYAISETHLKFSA